MSQKDLNSVLVAALSANILMHVRLEKRVCSILLHVTTGESLIEFCLGGPLTGGAAFW